MNIKELNEAIDKALKEDYKELQNDKSLDVYRKILNDSAKIDDYVFQDKKHVLVKFHNVDPQDRKQVIILDDKFEERLNKAYDKCRKVNESLKQTKSSKKSVNESYVVKEKDDCPIYNTVGCEECDMAAEGLCLIGTDIREFKQDNQNESVIDKKSIKEDESFKVGDFVFSRANFRYGYIKDFDGRLYTVEFVCSVEGSEEMAKTDSVAPAYLEDGNIRLDLKIADLERQLAAQKEIKEKFANKVTNEAVDAGKKSVKEEMEYNKKIWDIFEENIAEYLKEQGVTFDNAAEYIVKNGKEIIKAVLEKEYDYEEDDQAIFELYYNCPINFTDKAQAIDKLLEEYLAESLKRCLTLTDKLR